MKNCDHIDCDCSEKCIDCSFASYCFESSIIFFDGPKCNKCSFYGEGWDVCKFGYARWLYDNGYVDKHCDPYPNTPSKFL